MGFLARLSRIVPLIAGLAVLAAVVYLVVSLVRGSTRAKEVVIVMFTWITAALSAFCAMLSLYALLEGNGAVLELGVSCLAVGLVGLGITRWCRHVFVKNHPHYKDASQRARVIRRWPWSR